MAAYFRKRSKIRVPITLSVSLMVLNVTLMICWIVLLAQGAKWTLLAIGVLAFTVILAGLSIWLVLTLKEIGLNNRQANFVDSVTHELKSPIAALQLYLETLRMRSLSEEKRQEFHAVMASELQRLDQLISQLLEVGRLDAIGENDDPEELRLDVLLKSHAVNACRQWNCQPEEVLTFHLEPVVLRARSIVLDLILTNLIENAVKYAGIPPRVELMLQASGNDRVHLEITNNGAGVDPADRKKIFQIFYRGGSELERRRKGTGLGLYIVQTLVRRLKGRIAVHDRADDQPGCTFVLEIPGRVSRDVEILVPEPDAG